MTNEIVPMRVGHVRLGEDGIIYGVVTLPNAEETLADAKEIVESIKQVGQGQPRPLLSDVRRIKSATREARQYLARAENGTLVKANAILVDSWLSRVVANLYLQIARPPFPIRLFTDEARAIAWLKEFVE